MEQESKLFNTGRSSKLVDQLNTAIYLIKKNQIKIRLGVQWISSQPPKGQHNCMPNKLKTPLQVTATAIQ